MLKSKHDLTIKPEMSVCMFVRYLLRRLRTNWHQTWQGGRGRIRNLTWTLVSIVTNLLPWEPKKFDFCGQIRITV